jgi:hypothetical protein
MPILLPTRAELAHIPRRKRLAIRRAITEILSATDDVAIRHVSAIHSARAEGEAVREHARRLESVTPWDAPEVIAERRRVLLAAIR